MGKFGEEEEEPGSERRRKYTGLGIRERRASRMPYFSLGEDRRGISRSRDICLKILITSLSGSKSPAPSASRFFHFRRPPGMRLAFDAAKKAENLAAFSAREIKRAAAEEREDSSAEEQ